MVPTFHFLYLPLPGYEGCFEVLKVTFELDEFLGGNVDIITSQTTNSCIVTALTVNECARLNTVP